MGGTKKLRIISRISYESTNIRQEREREREKVFVKKSVI